MTTSNERRLNRLEQSAGAGTEQVELLGVKTTPAAVTRMVRQAQGTALPVVAHDQPERRDESA